MISARRRRMTITTAVMLCSGAWACAPDPGYKGRSSVEWIHELQEGTLNERVDAAFALGHVLELQPNAQGVATALTTAVRDTSDEVRIAAAVALRRAGARAANAAPAIAEMLSDTAHANVRRTAATILGDLAGYDPGTVAPALSRALTDPDASVRYAAAGALGRLGNRAAGVAMQLVSTTSDPDPGVRTQAIDALSRVAAPHDIVTVVLRRALADTVPAVRVAAVQAIARLASDPTQLSVALRETATDPQPLVRLAVVNALSVTDDGRAREILRRAAVDSNPLVRREAQHMLSSAHHPGDTHPLKEPSLMERCRSGAARATDRC